jgi:hypothetical protein
MPARLRGASYRGRKVGSIGDMGGFSLNVHKTITAGDGGLLTARTETHYRAAFGVHDQGHSPLRAGLEVGRRSCLGLNFRMNEITGALALAQLRKIDLIIAALRKMKSKFKDQIAGIPGMHFRKLNDPQGECGTLLTVLFDDPRRAASVAGALGTKTVDKSGWHVYANMEHVNQYLKEHGQPHGPGAYPRADDILSRAINLSVGVVDAGAGRGLRHQYQIHRRGDRRGCPKIPRGLRRCDEKCSQADEEEDLKVSKMKKKPNQIRVGLIGTGWMGFAHSHAFRNAATWYNLPVKLVMKVVCSRSEKTVAAFANRFDWEETETDWRKVVAREDVDLVCVATPGDSHADIAIEAAKHGKHILCEKPLANSLAEAERMKEAAVAAGVRHCCGYSYRFTPATALAARFCARGPPWPHLPCSRPLCAGLARQSRLPHGLALR